jgi:MFS family permease
LRRLMHTRCMLVAASWSLYTDSQSQDGLLQAPMVGTWSDVLGRRPFLLMSMCLGSLPLGVLLCHLTLGTSLLFYYPASAAGGAVSIISICLAYIADLLTPCYRCAFRTSSE